MSFESGDVLDKAIIYEKTEKPFGIIKSGLEFCIRHNIALPRIYWELRHEGILKKRHVSIEMYLKNCDKCGDEIGVCILVNFKVYCQECYKGKPN